ncbi:hypothetical protein Tco_0831681 [Tanacetum coccineum]
MVKSLVVLKILFSVSTCVMAAALTYGLLMDGFSSCFDPRASAVICGYIIMLLFKLTPEESSKDPIYFVLARRQKCDDMGYKRAPSVVTARVIVAALGCLMKGALVYAFVGDGTPFHMEVLTPCMITALTDINIIHIVVFSAWITYKESSWITAFFWAL